MTQAVVAGVTRLVAMGVDLEKSRIALDLARQYPEVWAGIGHHPSETSGPELQALRNLSTDPKVVALGEIGLDFEQADSPPRDVQIERLNVLFGLAVELDLPVSVHNRGAAPELAEVVAAHPGLRGVMHYFALDWGWAMRFLDLGFYLSFAGIVTRPSRSALREVVQQCPEHRLLLETDSPYGNAHKRMGVPNRPAYLTDTAEMVAEIRGISLYHLADVEMANAMALFTKMR